MVSSLVHPTQSSVGADPASTGVSEWVYVRWVAAYATMATPEWTARSIAHLDAGVALARPLLSVPLAILTLMSAQALVCVMITTPLIAQPKLAWKSSVIRLVTPVWARLAIVAPAAMKTLV